MSEYEIRVIETKNITVEADSPEDALNKAAEYAVSVEPDTIETRLISVTMR